MEAVERAINFAAGPARLPDEVLLRAKEELLNYKGTGISMLELSHRSNTFVDVVKSAEQNVRDLLNIPSNYKILFLQGGGCGQFAAVPLNLVKSGQTADYVVTGNWSSKAAQEAKKYCDVNLVVPDNKKYTSIPDPETWKVSPNASYFYYCDNETIHGVEFPYIPESPNGVPLVCDMSSNILSRPVNVDQYGLIYAGSQKNIGTAGSTLVIIREDLINKASNLCPTIWDYNIQLDNTSLYNTPVTFSIYVMNLVFEWLKERGGVQQMEELCRQKAKTLYDVIDSSEGFYWNPVAPKARSRINIPFRVGGSEGNSVLEKQFLEEAFKLNMVELKGHRSVGGLRASLYNAISTDDAQKLATFMQDFQESHSE